MTETTTDYRQIVIDSAELHSVAGDDWETSLLTGAPEPFGRDEALGIARFLEWEADVNWGWNQRHHDIAGEIRRRVAWAARISHPVGVVNRRP